MKIEKIGVVMVLCVALGLPMWLINSGQGKQPCSGDLQAYQRIELCFGAIPKEDWEVFLKNHVDPYLQGYNIKISSGRWKGVPEESFEIQIIYFEIDEEVENRVELIRKEYKEAYHQESVLLQKFPVCAQF